MPPSRLAAPTFTTWKRSSDFEEDSFGHDESQTNYLYRPMRCPGFNCT